MNTYLIANQFAPNRYKRIGEISFVKAHKSWTYSEDYYVSLEQAKEIGKAIRWIELQEIKPCDMKLDSGLRITRISE